MESVCLLASSSLRDSPEPRGLEDEAWLRGANPEQTMVPASVRSTTGEQGGGEDAHHSW